MTPATSSIAAVSRYLARYAEPVPADSPDKNYDFVLILPMFDEQPEALARLLQHTCHHNILVIVVINAPDNASEEKRERTRALLQTAKSSCPVDCWVIDAVSQPLPAKQGVGLARKTGSDAACRLWANGQIRHMWLYQCDADAVLPPNYFSTRMPDRGAVVFTHQHHSEDPLLQRAAGLYEQHMAHYVNGLQRAGSRYAYPTLGSTMAVHLHDYCLVRGFPKRSAAEDFYLLNKLAKVNPVTLKKEVVVSLEARLSERVPFGTGPALQKIIDGLVEDPSGAFYRTYHPQSFVLLAEALDQLDRLADNSALRDDHPGRYLHQLGIKKISDQLQAKYPTRRQRTEMLAQWFDAGRTLRFIHMARETFPDVRLNDIGIRTHDT